MPRPSASKQHWYVARDKKKLGPYSWQQLQTLAEAGELHPDDMLLLEGAQQWGRAGMLPALFATAADQPAKAAADQPAKAAADQPAKAAADQPVRKTSKVSPPVPAAPVKPSLRSRNPTRRISVRLLAGIIGTSVSVVFGLCLLTGYFFFGSGATIEPRHANENKIVEEIQHTGKELAKNDDGVPKKIVVKPKQDEEKRPAEEKKQPQGSAGEERFLDRLNHYRKVAGLGNVTLDAELSRGCLAHLRYLAKHINRQAADVSNVYDEDSNKPGYSAEGQRAGQSAMIAFTDPMFALERWMGRLFSRVPLLSADMLSIGLACEQVEKGEWICVLDPLRGRGDLIIVYPAPKEQDVPLAFTGGPEVADPKAGGGYPITVTFPPTKKVSDARMELRDDQGMVADGWMWTPEKPVTNALQRNTIALIPKELLRPRCTYQVKASAQIDGKEWSLAWSFTTDDDSDNKGLWAKKALAKVNAYRTLAGLPPVALAENLTRGCLAHARYLAINADHPALLGLQAHDEDKTLPGYSVEGQQAGKSSNLAIGDYEPLDGIDAWMATLYHRVGILDPKLRTIGFGCALGRRNGWITVLNVLTGRDPAIAPRAVFYPAPEQKDVPLNFPISGEEPNPIPQAKDGRAGYPITASFPDREPLKNAAGQLLNSRGEAVPCWFSSPENPANAQFAKHQGNTICLIAKRPLDANAAYQVHVSGDQAGKPWEKKWRFTTGASGMSVMQAKRQVLERINHYRTRAGLAAVRFDEMLSRGCLLHAEYLVTNAEAMNMRNASVNDEDPLLPGFTADGLQAAKHSDVFTHAPVTVTQIDNLMATFTRRVYLLDPTLQRVGFGAANDVGRGWRCVLDLNRGRGDQRVIIYPAAQQEDVPCTGDDLIEKAKSGPVGFPITATFPRQAILRNVQAVLTDADGKNMNVWLSAPEKPLNEKLQLQRNTIALHPLAPLQPSQTYSVTVSAIVNAAEWRETWQFTTSKNASIEPRP